MLYKVIVPTASVSLGLVLLLGGWPIILPLLWLGVKIGCVASAIGFLLALCK